MMSLFNNRQEANLKTCTQMVEGVLSARGLDAEGSRLHNDEGPAWNLRHGTAKVYVFLSSGVQGVNYIQVISPVMRPPAEDLASPRLFRRLLELNARELIGAAFGVRDDEVVLSADRSTGDLDSGEVEKMIRRVAEYADHYDDALVAEFGGVRHCDIEAS
jgi:hypothetical protein